MRTGDAQNVLRGLELLQIAGTARDAAGKRHADPTAARRGRRSPGLSARTSSTSPSEYWDAIDDYLTARHVHHDRSVDVAAAVVRRKHDELALDRHRQRFHLPFPAWRQMSRSREFLGKARRETPISRLVIFADDPDIVRLEIAPRRAMIPS